MISPRKLTLAAAAVAVLAVGAVSAAAGAVATGVTITPNPPATLVSPGIGGQYGVYNFTVQLPGADDPAAGFVSGLKFGHCIDSGRNAAPVVGTLRSGADLQLQNSDAANLAVQPGGSNRLEWLLLSSRRSVADAATQADREFQGAAHQKAVWLLTNPTTGGPPVGANARLNDPAFVARANQLFADSATNGASVGQAASLMATPAGTTTALHLTGAPFTGVNLAVTGSGHLVIGGANAGATASVILGAAGTADASLVPDGTGNVTVAATFEVPTMVQAQAPNAPPLAQNFAYLEFRPLSVQATVTFAGTPPAPVATPAAPATAVTPAVAPTVTVAAAGSPTVAARTRLRVTKTAPKAALSRERVIYRISVRNTGKVTARNVVLIDRMPRGMALVSKPKGATIRSGGRLRWSLGSLRPGRSASATVVFRTDTGVSGRLCNTATASAGNAPAASAHACTVVARVAQARRVVPRVTG
ncbi:MAG TPA: DUF11 domain-containing protein [Miltoncostaeaceae bacterium]|nr:DUF11 domain-containing protein [Miltoncostaeaceae bacterium]